MFSARRAPAEGGLRGRGGIPGGAQTHKSLAGNPSQKPVAAVCASGRGRVGSPVIFSKPESCPVRRPGGLFPPLRWLADGQEAGQVSGASAIAALVLNPSVSVRRLGARPVPARERLRSPCQPVVPVQTRSTRTNPSTFVKDMAVLKACKPVRRELVFA